MAGHDIIAVGASAGGVPALQRICAALPENLPAAVFVVMHLSPGSRSLLADILNRAGGPPACQPEDGEEIRPGRIYTAVPDRHMLIEDGHVHLSGGPKENSARPAIDPLFRSAAARYGPRVVGVVLTGTLDDGTAGLVYIKEQGGIAVVQDPQDAAYPDMPSSAIRFDHPDYVLPLAGIPDILAKLANEPAAGEGGVSTEMGLEEDLEAVKQGREHFELGEANGRPTVLTCPECGGVLWELKADSLVRYRCHVGHAYTAQSLFVEQTHALEDTLWSAVRTLQERDMLFRRLATQQRSAGHDTLAERYEERASEASQQAVAVADLVRSTQVLSISEPSEPEAA